MNSLPPHLLTRTIELSPQGVVVCERRDGDWVATYVNAAFEKLTGYEGRSLLGHDLRLLQGADRDQEGRQRIRAALQLGEGCRVLLRNYRSDGSSFWNEMTLEPVKDGSGVVTQFIGFHRDAGERLRLDNKTVGAGGTRETFGATGAQISPLSALRDDRLTGLYTRDYFHELLLRDWAIAQREQRNLTLFLFDIDCLTAYNDTFGQSAGDACIKRVARAIGGCLRRGSDLAARLEGGTTAALAHNMESAASLKFAQDLLERVREQHIHHPHSSVQRYVTVSGGLAGMTPAKDQPVQSLLDRAQAALKAAKDAGRNCVKPG